MDERENSPKTREATAFMPRRGRPHTTEHVCFRRLWTRGKTVTRRGRPQTSEHVCGRDGKQLQDEGGHSLRAKTREAKYRWTYLFQAPVDEKETGPKTREARAFMPGDSCFRPASVSPSTFHPANTSARACACALGLDEKGRRGDGVGWGAGAV